MMTDGRQRFLDRLYVLLLGAAIAALAWFWRFDSTPPDLMDDLAAAAGLRPPTGPLGLLWQHIAAPLCQNYGLATAEAVLRTAGHVSLGVFALLSSILLEMMLPATLLRGMHVASWWRRAVRFVLFQGIILFCCADPVWNAFRWFSPLSLQLLLVAFAAILFLSHLRTDRRFLLFATFAVLGLLAADTPIGAVLFVVVVGTLGVRRHLRNAGVLETPEESPFARAFMSLRLTLAFGIGLFAGVALEVYAFSSLDGLAAFDWTWGDYALEVPILYIKALLSTVSPAGAALILAGTVLPVVIEFQLIRRATDDEKHLAYVYGAAFAAFGVIAFSQLAGAKSLWFWTWGGGCVADGLLKCIAVYLCALSAVWSLAVFVIELFLRNFRRIETLRFPDALDAEDAAPALASARRLQRIVRAVFLIEPVLVLACVLPFRAQRVERLRGARDEDKPRGVGVDSVDCAGHEGPVPKRSALGMRGDDSVHHSAELPARKRLDGHSGGLVVGEEGFVLEDAGNAHGRIRGGDVVAFLGEFAHLDLLPSAELHPLRRAASVDKNSAFRHRLAHERARTQGEHKKKGGIKPDAASLYRECPVFDQSLHS